MIFKLGQVWRTIAWQKNNAKSDRNEVSELKQIIARGYFNLKTTYANAITLFSDHRVREVKWAIPIIISGYSYKAAICQWITAISKDNWWE